MNRCGWLGRIEKRCSKKKVESHNFRKHWRIKDVILVLFDIWWYKWGVWSRLIQFKNLSKVQKNCSMRPKFLLVFKVLSPSAGAEGVRDKWPKRINGIRKKMKNVWWYNQAWDFQILFQQNTENTFYQCKNLPLRIARPGPNSIDFLLFVYSMSREFVLIKRWGFLFKCNLQFRYTIIVKKIFLTKVKRKSGKNLIIVGKYVFCEDFVKYLINDMKNNEQ